jgi:hypothetical protein
MGDALQHFIKRVEQQRIRSNKFVSSFSLSLSSVLSCILALSAPLLSPAFFPTISLSSSAPSLVFLRNDSVSEMDRLLSIVKEEEAVYDLFFQEAVRQVLFFLYSLLFPFAFSFVRCFTFSFFIPFLSSPSFLVLLPSFLPSFLPLLSVYFSMS